jgi:pantothenate synthetase
LPRLAGAVLDYAVVVDTDTLLPRWKLDYPPGPVLIALAVRFGSTRLIDNVILR